MLIYRTYIPLKFQGKWGYNSTPANGNFKKLDYYKSPEYEDTSDKDSENKKSDLYYDTINVMADTGGEVGDKVDEYVGVVDGDCYILSEYVRVEHLSTYQCLDS